MTRWIIEDWMGKRVFTDKTFGSFEEARGFIMDYASQEAGDDEEAYDGICDDLYAEEEGS
jgi:hypothetical protein